MNDARMTTDPTDDQIARQSKTFACPACGPMHQLHDGEMWCDDCGDYHAPPVTTYSDEGHPG